MSSSRLEAFSDGVLAIIITIMVLELHTPEGSSFSDLVHGTGLGFLTYVLSFAYVGIYWTNHHHLFQVVEHVTGSVLWANLNLLFWLSLLPLTTDWMDVTRLARVPVMVYGVDLALAALSWLILVRVLRHHQPAGSPLDRALGNAHKTRLSPLLYAVGIAAAALADFLPPYVGVLVALAMYMVTGLLWAIPDRNVERVVKGVQ